jgi:SAM-dependent methyltransferase/uncharacterized protein YbaR (Trm112 family)
MREKLLEVLAEPGTGAPLQLQCTQRQGDHVVEGTLTSSTSGQVYPIRGGIPRFVPPTTYAASFGLQWNRFRRVQLDSEGSRDYSTRRFDAELSWSEQELRGRWVLDAGCGAGRFAEVAAARGADLVALDYSSAVEATRETLSRFPNVDVVQADLLAPPFRRGAFDRAYCIGVVQHTPDPEKVIANVVNCVRNGGRFGFTIYARKPWTKLNGKYLLRPLTRRLPPQMLLKAIELAMPVLFPLTDRLYRLPGVGRAAQFAIPVATYVDRDDQKRDHRYREAVLDTFDALSPRYDSPMTWQEVEAVLRSVGASDWQFRTRVPINVVGERALSS